MFISTVILLVIFLYFLKKNLTPNKTIRELGDKIPGPKPLPIVGNALELGLSPKSLFQYSKRLAKEHGSICRVWLGPQLGVMISDPHYAQYLLSSMKHIDKSITYKFTEQFGENGLVFTTGEVWKLHRKIIAPTLSGKHVTHFLEVFSSNLDLLIDQLSQHQNGPSFDILPILSLYALENVCEYGTGVKMNVMLDQDSEYCKAISSLEHIVVKRGLLPWLYPDVTFRLSSLGQEQKRHLDVINTLTKRIIEARKQEMFTESAETNVKDAGTENTHNGMKSNAFLDNLLLQVQKGENLSDKDIQDEVNTIIGAGHDTTAHTLGFACWFLAKHPDIQEKAVEELRSVFGDSLRHATLQDLNELKYLDQIVKETLRLLPPAAVIARRLREDLITDKYVIPAGTEVALNVYMLHRHPHHFHDPERFDPDRFLPENCTNRHPYAYIPFSAGPRNCVGYKFALYQIMTTMATILRNFKLLPPENPFQDLDLVSQIVMKPQNGVLLKLQPRHF